MNGYRLYSCNIHSSQTSHFLTVSGFSGVLPLNLANLNSQGTRQKLCDSTVIVYPRSQTPTPKIWSTIFDQVPPLNKFYQPSPSFGLNHPFYGIFTQPESYPSFPPSLSTPYLYILEHICTYGQNNKSTQAHRDFVELLR